MEEDTDSVADNSAPDDIGSTFDVPNIIRGLVDDLAQLRAGKITAKEAQIRADVAKQIFAGLRLIVQTQKYLSTQAKPVREIGAIS